MLLYCSTQRVMTLYCDGHLVCTCASVHLFANAKDYDTSCHEQDHAFAAVHDLQHSRGQSHKLYSVLFATTASLNAAALAWLWKQLAANAGM